MMTSVHDVCWYKEGKSCIDIDEPAEWVSLRRLLHDKFNLFFTDGRFN